MRIASLRRLLGSTFLVGCATLLFSAQEPASPLQHAEVTAKLAPATPAPARKTQKAPVAVMWLNPLQSGTVSRIAPGNFTLLQKNKMFTPHLLVVPVGSSVAFPNADPFFHNVFSLFDGRRFDLGLYEAGSTRSVQFSREGVSYIFCNIHSEMSAVVISLASPLYSFADLQGAFHLKDVPDGDYEMHIWIEGQKQSVLDQLTRRVHVVGAAANLGEIHSGHSIEAPHLNKFGRPYEPDANPIY
jgi:plastocyanin